MVLRVLAGRAAEAEQVGPDETVSGRIESRVLTGEGEGDPGASGEESVEKGSELDGFGTGPGDEHDVGVAHRWPLDKERSGGGRTRASAAQAQAQRKLSA